MSSGGSSSGSAVRGRHAAQVDFALGTDTAGSGRVPAGLNNIVGLKPIRGPDQHARRGAGGAERRLRVDLRAAPWRSRARARSAAMGHDAADPYSRDLALASRPLPQGFRFGVPVGARVLRRHAGRGRLRAALARCARWAARRSTIDYAPLARGRGAALRQRAGGRALRRDARLLRRARGRSDRAGARHHRQGRDYSAADLSKRRRAAARWASRRAAMWHDIDVLLVPTAPTHYTIAQMQADPVALNRNLGAYTNFVNLLDYAAIAVPGGAPPRRPAVRHHADRPLRQRLAAGRARPALSPCHRADAGRDRRAAAAPERHCRRCAAAAQREGRRRRRAPLGHAAQRPVDRARRRACCAHDAHRAGLPLFALPGTTPPKPGLLRVARRRRRARSRSKSGTCRWRTTARSSR